MYKVDLHTHSRFFHGYPGRQTPFDPIGAGLLARIGSARGLDGIALTNHDYYPEIGDQGRKLAVIPGIEISTTRGHALVVGPDPPTQTPPGELTPDEAVTLAHETGCAAIIAHPFRAGSVRESDAAFDAVEINGKHIDDVDKVRALANSHDLPIVGGSDAHFPFEVGRAHTAIDVESLTPSAVANAIRQGHVEPRVIDSTLNRTIQRVYRYIHRYIRRNP